MKTFLICCFLSHVKLNKIGSDCQVSILAVYWDASVPVVPPNSGKAISTYLFTWFVSITNVQ